MNSWRLNNCWAAQRDGPLRKLFVVGLLAQSFEKGEHHLHRNPMRADNDDYDDDDKH